MSYRDPLYDSNVRPEGSTLEEQIDATVVDETGARNRMPGGSDTMSGEGDHGKADQVKKQGQQAMGQAREKGEQAMGQAREKGDQAMETAKEKASQVSDQASQKADQGLDKASSGLSTAADKLRQQGEQQEGQVGNVASTAADKLESASGYLQQSGTDQMVSDLEDLIRRRPVESMVAAAGIGLLLSRIFK